jgi:hypothetical protein
MCHRGSGYQTHCHAIAGKEGAGAKAASRIENASCKALIKEGR